MEKGVDVRRMWRNHRVMMVLYPVLLFVFIAGGCRDSETGPGQSQPVPFTLSFAPGDQFVYDTWVLDYRYPGLPSTKSQTLWRVLRTGEQHNSMSNVTVVLDSSGTAARDTLYIAASTSGDLWMYGFLSRIAKRRTGQDIVPRWDCIASFSAGITGTWTVGVMDSLGQDVVYGSLSGGSEMVTATVNGVAEVFPTYRVDLTGPTLYYSIWFAGAPNAIVRWLEEPDYLAKGLLREIVAISTAPR